MIQFLNAFSIGAGFGVGNEYANEDESAGRFAITNLFPKPPLARALQDPRGGGREAAAKGGHDHPVSPQWGHLHITIWGISLCLPRLFAALQAKWKKGEFCDS